MGPESGPHSIDPKLPRHDILTKTRRVALRRGWRGRAPKPQPDATTSRCGGGANTVSEALAAGVPVVASNIPGNTGMLGEDYPGYYEVGYEGALARLLHRAETDAGLYALLRDRCAARVYLTWPEREWEALGRLVREL